MLNPPTVWLYYSITIIYYYYVHSLLVCSMHITSMRKVLLTFMWYINTKITVIKAHHSVVHLDGDTEEESLKLSGYVEALLKSLWMGEGDNWG